MMQFFRKNRLPSTSGPILLFDMGGTKMRAAVCRDGVTLEEPVVAPNIQDFDQAMKLAGELGARALNGESPRLVVVGIAGILASGGTTLYSSPHLPLWSEKPLVEKMRDMFMCPIRLENDAALAGLGEAVYGAGRGHPIVAYLTVSTGIGGARIVEGRIDMKAVGFEPGHQVVDMNTFDAEGKGELETLASGSAIERRFNIAPKYLSDAKIIGELAHTLAVGVTNTILHWSPDVVVMGGSIMLGENSIPIRDVERMVREHLNFLPRTPAFALAKLGDAAGLHGALAYALKSK